MMIMPFIRLIAIYVVVILAIIGFFKREQLMELTGLSFERAQPAQVDDPEPVAAAEPVAVASEGGAQPATTVSAPRVTDGSEPVATDQSGQPVIVMPTAAPQDLAQQDLAQQDLAQQGSANTQQAALQPPRADTPVAPQSRPQSRPELLPIVQPTPDQPEPAQTGGVKPAAAALQTPAQTPAQTLAQTSAQTSATAGAEAVAEPVAAPVPAQASQTAQPKPAPKPVPNPTSAPVDVQARLSEARQAYWAGDLAKSEALYLALALDAPANADVNGELGNLFYARRNYAKAAEAYLVTGKLLVANGNPAQIMPIISVLQSIAPDKAAALRALAAN